MPKNEKGQVLLIVVLISAISLIITFSVVARVSRLTKTVTETEEHEAAFATAEEYSRKVLDEIKRGETADPEEIIANVGETEEVDISFNAISQAEGIFIQNGMTYEINPNAVAGTLTIISNLKSSDVQTLLSVIGYTPSDGEYSIRKDLWGSSCADSNDDNISACSFDGASTNRITITVSIDANVRSVRLRSIGGDQEVSIRGEASIAGQILALANEYVVTATKMFGDGNTGVKSEAKLTLPSGKSMPTIFDYVLFNGEGTIVQ